MSKIEFFDLDYTLWRMPSKLVVILKNEPEKVIYKIPSDQYKMMKSFYKTYDLPVHYNGNTFYLNDKIWDDILKINNKVKLEDIGISFRDWTEEDYLEEQIPKTEYLLDNIKVLKNEDVDIAILTARSHKDEHKNNLKILKDKIYSKIKKIVKKVYFINDLDNNMNTEISASRKTKILIEHLIGFKIKNGKFVPLKQSEYESVSLYDDEDANISSVDDIQNIFESYLLKTNPKLKEIILKRVENIDLYYTSNKITSNKLMPIITNTQKLLLPSYIVKFDEF
jgi:hypothetical protein